VPADEAVVPALVRALEDDDPTVAYNAAVTLGLMGQKARAAIPALTQALRSDRAVRPVPLVNRQVADGVGMALRQIDPAGAAKVGLK
jgi:HEAT repeat protein